MIKKRYVLFPICGLLASLSSQQIAAVDPSPSTKTRTGLFLKYFMSKTMHETPPLSTLNQIKTPIPEKKFICADCPLSLLWRCKGSVAIRKLSSLQRGGLICSLGTAGLTWWSTRQTSDSCHHHHH